MAPKGGFKSAKRAAAADDDDDEVLSPPKTKKARTEGRQKDDEGNEYWEVCLRIINCHLPHTGESNDETKINSDNRSRTIAASASAISKARLLSILGSITRKTAKLCQGRRFVIFLS